MLWQATEFIQIPGAPFTGSHTKFTGITFVYQSYCCVRSLICKIDSNRYQNYKSDE